MKSVFKLLLIAFASLIIFFLIMFVIWFFYPQKASNIIILDKTVHEENYLDNKSVFWVLNNERFIKKSGQLYDYCQDYYGFIRGKQSNSKEYVVKRIQLELVDSFSNYYDILYYIDTYGVLYNNWYGNSIADYSISLVDAGLKNTEYLLLKEMVDKKKLTICEFNIIGSPTSELVREKFSDLYGFNWKGWFGKYYSTLSTNNSEIPKWIIEKYKLTNKKWPFVKGGVIILNPLGNIIVLEEGRELTKALPAIITGNNFIKKFSLPKQYNYSGWFEIIEVNDSMQTEAQLILNTTATGDSILKTNSLSNINPLILSYKDRMYYIAADFSHGNFKYSTSFLATVGKWYGYIYKNNPEKGFTWNYYRPLISGIMNQYVIQQQQ